LTTYVFSKKQFIDQMGKFIGDDEVIILSNTACGSFAVNKKQHGKTISMHFAEDTFANQETISDIIHAKVLAVIACKKDMLSEKAQKSVGVEE
jgi:hypothetical protein